MDEVPAPLMAAAELKLRELELRKTLAERYDWYGDECSCGLPLGHCRIHPRARPDQRPPGSYRASDPSTHWRKWMVLGGRGSGKTRPAAEYINREVEAGSITWVGLVNDTMADVRDVQIEHPRSGLIVTAPPWFKPVYEPSKRRLTWPNGAYATMYSAEEPDQLRGPGFELGWPDEPAKWKQKGRREAISNLDMCLRERREDGKTVKMVMTTTPQETEEFFELLDDERIIKTGGTTFDNKAHLDDEFLADMEKIKDTRKGRMELLAIVERVIAGALWAPTDIRYDPEAGRSLFTRIVVSVDPNAGSKDPNLAAECGITVCGKMRSGRMRVLADMSTKGGPEIWGRQALIAYQLFDADAIVGEINNGGDMVAHVIKTIPKGPLNPSGAHIKFIAVRASRGKTARAEPVQGLYAADMVRHVARFDELERQLTHYKPDQPNELKRKDRMDSVVWGITELAQLSAKKTKSEYRTGGHRPGLYLSPAPRMDICGVVSNPFGNN